MRVPNHQYGMFNQDKSYCKISGSVVQCEVRIYTRAGQCQREGNELSGNDFCREILLGIKAHAVAELKTMHAVMPCAFRRGSRLDKDMLSNIICKDQKEQG